MWFFPIHLKLDPQVEHLVLDLKIALDLGYALLVLCALVKKLPRLEASALHLTVHEVPRYLDHFGEAQAHVPVIDHVGVPCADSDKLLAVPPVRMSLLARLPLVNALLRAVRQFQKPSIG